MLENQISYEFKNESELKKAYMSFVSGGGLFIKTPEEFSLGDELSLTLVLPDSSRTDALRARVIWITPDPEKITWIATNSTAGDDISPGIGVQIVGPDLESFQKIISDYSLDDGASTSGSDTL